MYRRYAPLTPKVAINQHRRHFPPDTEGGDHRSLYAPKVPHFVEDDYLWLIKDQPYLCAAGAYLFSTLRRDHLFTKGDLNAPAYNQSP